MRTLQKTAAVLGAAITLVLAMSGTANAAGSASGTINTAGSPLNVRTGPSSGWTAWRTVADGASVTILCQEIGSQETGLLPVSWVTSDPG